MKTKEKCESETLCKFFTEVLESHMRSLRQEAVTVCINHAQCELVVRRLQNICTTIRRLPDPSPTPQLLTVFRAADMLVQRMRHNGWVLLLERHLTCRSLFAALFDRIPCVWRLQMNESWTGDDFLAVRADEVMDARVFLDKFCAHSDTGRSPGKLQDSFCSLPDGKEGISGAQVGDSVEPLTEQEVIDTFRRQMLSKWRVSFEDLTPPEDKETPTTERRYIMFHLHYGYHYDGEPVLLYQLQETTDGLISPVTVTSFVQDMVARARWCHPNVVPFVGAFTERVLPACGASPEHHPNWDDDSRLSFESGGSPNTNSFEMSPGTDSIVEDTADAVPTGTPVLDLGYVIADIRCMTAELLGESENRLTAYCIREVKNNDSVQKFRPLYDVLFVEQRDFTLWEAITITLQVADCLQYMLMEENVPPEVLKAWMTVSPSHIYVCPIKAVDDVTDECRRESFGAGGMWPTDDDGYDEAEEDYDHDTAAPPFCTGSVQRRRYVELFVPGDWAVLYNPPAFVEGGPYSRWAPHPHAGCPETYAMAQLLIALVSKEPPYRLFTQQEDLARRVFDVDDLVHEEDPSLSVRVSIPVGSVIPQGLTPELKKLCSRAMTLHNPQVQGDLWNGLPLADFRSALWEVYVKGFSSLGSSTLNSTSWAGETTVPVGERLELSIGEEHVDERRSSTRILLDDYGERRTGTQ
uniref:Uncharacterized protein TCIL3000_3_240 n=1 Tax=Trypanosoma congolense (strain IL3000) TaxID=1068625 RepID=G0UJQ7_TRYCI|nr:unnamed protein product [Trypanosoma congolense IL3000]